MSRCVNGEHLLDEPSREVMRLMIWKIAEFCGAEVVTYAIMPNHFHILVHIPDRTHVADDELVRRYRLLHPKPTRFQPLRIEVVEQWLRDNTPEGKAWRKAQLALMFDLSAFMKLLKQRFTQWFNATHDRFGTLWAERFKSILVDHESEALRTMSAYIDLNAVRKGYVVDPKDYRFCGYAEATAGSSAARLGIRHVFPGSNWRQAHASYRCLLYGFGTAPRAHGATLPDADFEVVMNSNGELPWGTLLRQRWQYFSAGKILGRQAFILEMRSRLKLTSKSGTKPGNASSSTNAPVKIVPFLDLCSLTKSRRPRVVR